MSKATRQPRIGDAVLFGQYATGAVPASFPATIVATTGREGYADLILNLGLGQQSLTRVPFSPFVTRDHWSWPVN